MLWPSPSYHASSRAVVTKCVNGAKVRQISIKTGRTSGAQACASVKWASVGDEVRTDLPQVGPNVTDAVEHGAADIPRIALLVGLKPLTSVLTAQFRKKGKQCCVKVGRCRHV